VKRNEKFKENVGWGIAWLALISFRTGAQTVERFRLTHSFTRTHPTSLPPIQWHQVPSLATSGSRVQLRYREHVG
jgi:hypothetical protein